MNLTLTTIRIDGGTQARVALNQDVVAEYADIVRDGELPPVTVFFDGTAHWLADGYHRYFGYKAADRASIPCNIRAGTLREAIRFSFSANSKHGLRPTVADKRKAVAAMLADAEWSLLSDRAIAKELDVSHTFVANMRSPKAEQKPKVERQAPPESGNVATQKRDEGGNVATPAPISAPKTDAEQAAEDAHGDDDTLELLKDTQRELEDAQAQIKAAEADDLKAEAMKWHRIAELAQRRQNELMQRVNERESELTKLTNWLRRIGKAVGEDELSKIPAAVEAVARGARAAV